MEFTFQDYLQNFPKKYLFRKIAHVYFEIKDVDASKSTKYYTRVGQYHQTFAFHLSVSSMNTCL